MNRTESNSFQMQEIEIETLREQIQKEKNKNSLLAKSFIFLQGEVLGKQLNTQHPFYSHYIDYLETLKK